MTQASSEPLDTILTRAQALAEDGKPIRAIETLRPHLAENAENPALWFAFGNLARDVGRTEEAAQAYANVLKVRPGSVEAGSNLVHVLIDLERPIVAARMARDIARVGYGLAAVAQSMADAFNRLRLTEEAGTAYQRVLCRYPDQAAALSNLAELLARTGRDEDSLHWVARARIADPDDDQIGLHQALALMTTGRIRDGLATYEARLRPRAHDAPIRQGLTLARWRGEPLDGPLLVVAEQGLGDEIRFAASLTHLVRRGIPFVAECEPRLVALFQRSFPEATIVPHSGRKTGGRVSYDYDLSDGLDGSHPTPHPAAYIEAGSLPLMLDLIAEGVLLDRPIVEGAFLLPDTDSVEQFRRHIHDSAQEAGLPFDRPVIGLSWGSAVSHPARARLYPTVEDLEPILRLEGVTFVNLQYIDATADLATFRQRFGVTVLDTPWVDKRNDLDGAAALAAACDLVIGPASSVGVMAAAVGTRCIEMAPELSWLPRIPTSETLPTDGFLGAQIRVEYEPAENGAPSAAQPRPWLAVTQRTAEAARSMLGLR